MDKPEKLTTLCIKDTRRRQTKQKTQTKQHRTLCVGHHYAQTTEGKDELNIVLCEIVNGHHDHDYASHVYQIVKIDGLKFKKLM